MQKIHKTLTTPPVKTEVAITVGHHLEPDIVKLCRSFGSRIALVTDAAIATTFGKQLQHATGAELFSFSGGESAKTRETKQSFEDQLLKKKFGRDTLLVGLGGGVVTDFTAFLASTYMRGVPLVLIPTTLLAMVDASIGGKTGVDTPFGKNLIGTFYQPKAIFVDTSYLASLPEKEWTCGLAEILKYGLISDPSVWKFLEQNSHKWKESSHSLILSSIRVKKSIVERDPMETTGLRRIVNFGHTVAHALETLSEYSISHGEAVAIGCMSESYLSFRLGFLPEKEFHRIKTLFHKFPFLFKLPKKFEKKAFFEVVQMDKKAEDGVARFVLIDWIGHALPFEGKYCRPVESSHLEDLCAWMKETYV